MNCLSKHGRSSFLSLGTPYCRKHSPPHTSSELVFLSLAKQINRSIDRPTDPATCRFRPSRSDGERRFPRAPPPPRRRRRSIGAAYAAVTFLRPQGQSLVLYAAGPDGQQQRRIVFAYPVLPGDAFERLDGATLSWAEPESGDEFALCFLDDAACAAVCGALSPVVRSPTVDGVAETLVGLRVAREEGAPAPGRGGHRRAAGAAQHRPPMIHELNSRF